jgi:hypothetical protein
MASFGCQQSAIWKQSHSFFSSPPEKPSFRDRLSKADYQYSISAIFSFINLRKETASKASSPLLFANFVLPQS